MSQEHNYLENPYLLEIINKIKDDPSEININILSKVIKTIIDKSYRLGDGILYTVITENILNLLNKTTNKEFVFITEKYPNYIVALKEDLMYYINGHEKKIYISKETFIEKHRNEEVFKCSITNEWYHYSLKVHFKKNISKTPGSFTWEIITCASTKEIKNKLGICLNCNNRYEKINIITHPQTEKEVCVVCVLTKITNPTETKEENIIKGYHTHSNSWRFLIEKENKDELAMGLELEIHSRKGNTQNNAKESAWQIHQFQKEKENQCYFEWDGSLQEGGFEMITNPMSLAINKEYWFRMLPKIREVASGWNIQKLTGESGNYGIHITFNGKYFRDYRLARLIKFCDNKNNKNFIRGLAQRVRIYGREEPGQLANGSNKTLRSRITIRDKKILGSLTRYQPVHIKESRLVELRFFRSTLNTESFLKNIEFVHAFHRWSKETSFSIQAMDFCKWLTSSMYCKTMYPNLIGYFSRKELPVKGAPNSRLTNKYYKVFKTHQLDITRNFTTVTSEDFEILNKELELCA